MTQYKLGIIGNGFVGKATSVLKCKNIQLLLYDIDPKLCDPPNTTLKDLCKECDIIFISVPTPMKKDGSYYLNIVESVVKDISKYADLNKKHIVLRSTVTPGVSDHFNCFFMPEFLTEKNFLMDFKTNPDWIFGLKENNEEQNNDFKNTMSNIMTCAKYTNCIDSDKCHFVLNREAEMVKLFRNNYLAVKVSFCNEISDYCKVKHINYENVRQLAVLDPRVGGNHTQVPGHDGRGGFGGTCFPKDTAALRADMQSYNVKSYIIDAAITRNEKIDRPEKDWNANKGRSVV